MKIFENTLYDNQMELAQKGQEVTQLKIKLQTAELKLKELEDARGRQVKTNQIQTNPSQTEVEVVTETPGQSSEVPEIDFEGIILNVVTSLTTLWLNDIYEQIGVTVYNLQGSVECVCRVDHNWLFDLILVDCCKIIFTQ